MKFSSKKLLSTLLAAVLVVTATACNQKANSSSQAPSLYTAGTYTATANGMNGPVEVLVTVSDSAITDVKLGKHTETAGISDPAIAQIPAAIVKANGTAVDAVSGATITSDAIKKAVDNALLLAQGKELPQEPAKTVAFTDPDVIIVGAGFSGMNAALAATEAGAKVMMIDKNNDIGGSIRYAGGTLSGAGTQMQKAAEVVDTEADFMADIEKKGGGINVPELTKAHISRAAAAVDWMDSLGADFGDRKPTQPQTYDAFGIPREHRVKGGGKSMVELLRPKLDEQVAAGKLVIMLDTRVADITMDGTTVTGVVLDNAEKTAYTAKSVILATGGYGHNEEWLKRYNFKNVLTMAPDFVTGDGYNFAEKAGAKFNNMDYLPAYAGGVPVSDTGFVQSVSANTTKYPGVIWVGTDGKRVMDEFTATDGKKKEFWGSTNENIVWVLLTKEMRDTQEPILTVNSKADENWARFDSEAAKGEVIVEGATIEELAGKIGVPADVLAATVKTYNTDCAAGKDSAFGRTESLVSFEKGPFYAIKTVPYVMLTKGGPLMNAEAQTLNASGEPIAGLYQCGELVGGANIGGGASIGGLANTICIVWGKTAGGNAATYALS